MKRFASLIAAGIIGALITFGIFQFFGLNSKTVKIEHTSTPAVSASYEGGDNAANSNDFVKASEKAMPAVVHVKSIQSASAGRQQQRRQIPEPFRDFFDIPEGREGPGQRRPERPSASGSGVIISEDGYIVTNNHVISNADKLEVSLYDKRKYTAEVIGTDPSTDIALIKIDEANLPTLPFANSDEVKVGQHVLAVGNPFDLNSTVTAGIVSAKARSINILSRRNPSAIESFIQTDAAVNPGNSGGALVNTQGNLVGINTAIASPTGTYAGYAFAVPSNITSKVVEDLMKYGVVQRGYLGVMIRPLERVTDQNFNVSEGVYVDSLMEESAAAMAGIKPGDVITHADGERMESVAELQATIGKHRPGDEVEVRVLRDGEERTFKVTLRNKEGTTKVVEKEEKDILETLGAQFENLDRSELQELGIDHGVRLKSLGDGVLSNQTRIKEGFIITHVAGEPVESVDEVRNIIENSEGGIMVEGVYPGYPGKYYYGFGVPEEEDM